MELEVFDVPAMYVAVLETLREHGVGEETRNGSALSMQEPLMVSVAAPHRRVLMDENRCANPFFHVMEFIWMMAGSNDVKWISQFNKGFVDYAEKNGKIYGAYGYRWQRHFEDDQLATAVRMLCDNPLSRRVVLGMWDTQVDLGAERNDLPCNTHIYLRVLNGKLNMTVCNRSNDVVWGMTGANAVHMTLLQELLCHATGFMMGTYTVMSNNAHIYERHFPLMKTYNSPQRVVAVEPAPLFQPGEEWTDFMEEAGHFIEGNWERVQNEWLKGTALPMYRVYLNVDDTSVHQINCAEWRIACVQWLHWVRQ